MRDLSRNLRSVAALAAAHSTYHSGEEDTLVERAGTLIHHDILTGLLPPDSKLGIHKLAKRYQMGHTPIREALSRLCPLGFVKASANRGFQVHPVSQEDLTDIVGTRLIVEVEALRRSIQCGNDEWEAEILSALHRYQKFVERRPRVFWQGEFEYDRVHKQLHMALISACDLPRLIEVSEILYDQNYRYRCVALSKARRGRAPRLIEVHTKLAAFAIDRNVNAACEELARQIRVILTTVYPESQSGPPRPYIAKRKN